MNELIRDEKGRFMPGCSGNPGGRPKTPAEFRQLAQEATTLALERVIDILKNPATKDRDVIAAAQEVMDRAYGKPSQQIEASVEDKRPDLRADWQDKIRQMDEDKRGRLIVLMREIKQLIEGGG